MHAMKNIQIRNVPEKTHSVLRKRASDAGMSLQEYLLGMVKEAAARPTVAEVLQRAEKQSAGKFRMQDVVEDLRKDRTTR